MRRAFPPRTSGFGDTGTPMKRLRVQLPFIVAVRVILNTAYRMVYPFLPVFARALGVDVKTMALALTARAASGAAGPLVAPLSDQRGRRFGMTLGLGLFVVGAAFPVFSPRLVWFAAALVLAGCNFTLAEDITPPPDYVPPTPMPTLGALYPASAPDVQKGASIFAEHCAACHGTTGLGDGPQSMQLPVTVPGIGLAEVARNASPAQWFKVVTQGNLDRFMPPFVGALSDQDRWNVISYVLTLHTTPDALERGRSLVDADCPQCAAAFTNLEKLSALSDTDLVRIIRTGEADVPAFAKDYSDDDAYAAAAHIRSLSFARPVEVAAQPEATAQATLVNGTPSVESGTPAIAGIGTVNGALWLHWTARRRFLPGAWVRRLQDDCLLTFIRVRSPSRFDGPRFPSRSARYFRPCYRRANLCTPREADRNRRVGLRVAAILLGKCHQR